MRDKRKAQLLYSHFLGLMIILIAFVIVLAVWLLSTNQTLTSHKTAEETSAVNTYLYVLLNNNHCTPNTKLPLKSVISTALAQGEDSADSEIPIKYNGGEDNIKVSECIDWFKETYYINEMYFYIEYKDDDKIFQYPDDVDLDLVLEELESDDEESKIMSEETEYISVPGSSEIARVKLVIESNANTDSDSGSCPDTDEMHCVQAKTCQIYGGICKISYTCGINQCCCKDLPL